MAYSNPLDVILSAVKVVVEMSPNEGEANEAVEVTFTFAASGVPLAGVS